MIVSFPPPFYSIFEIMGRGSNFRIRKASLVITDAAS